jgi:cytochrome c-type biogenesis protein CcmH
MFFWIAAFLIALGVAASLAQPLLGRPGRTAGPHRAGAIHRAQLAEVDRDLARGLIDVEEAARARTEVARRILEADRDRPAAAGAAPARISRLAAALAGLLLVAGSFGLYRLVGSPGLDNQPRALRIAEGDALRAARPSQAEAEAAVADIIAANRITPPPDIAAKVARLRAELAANPDDLMGWQMLTDVETQTGNLPAAVAAMAEVVRIKGESATVEDLVGLVDRMVFSAQGHVSPETEAVLDRIAGLEPENLALLYYTGLLYAETDRADLAFLLWRRVIEEGGDSLHARLARDGIADVAWLSGRDYTPPDLPGPGPGPGPGAEAVAAAADMAPEDREAMIRGMVEGLSDRLGQDGGTAEEWARLITSLGVLGETARAEEARARAEAAFAQSPSDLATIRAAAAGAGLPE